MPISPLTHHFGDQKSSKKCPSLLNSPSFSYHETGEPLMREIVDSGKTTQLPIRFERPYKVKLVQIIVTPGNSAKEFLELPWPVPPESKSRSPLFFWGVLFPTYSANPFRVSIQLRRKFQHAHAEELKPFITRRSHECVQ